MKIQLTRNPKTEQLPAGVFYISQDNYELVNVPSSLAEYLYCDSATSCIIIIVSGKNKSGVCSVAISHLSRPERFKAFFEIVEKEFADNISVFAQGANPPEPGNKDGMPDYTAMRNLNIVNEWILKHSVSNSSAVSPLIKQSTLLFGEGNPSLYANNLDCYGINITNPSYLVVSNRRFHLTSQDRDPSGGLQSLFCPYGLKLNPPLTLIQARNAFRATDINSLIYNQKKLVDMAHADNYERYVSMTDEEILAECSSTPDAEVPWFCDTIRQASQYVINHYKS